MAEEERPKIIIRKVKKKGGHGGHHGGSWKVAYADFVTAMMAFFLLMWLISQVPQETKEQLSDYFQNFNIFEKGGSTFVDKGNVARPGADAGVAGTSDQPPGQAVEQVEGALQMAQQMAQLQQALDASISDIKDQVIIETFDGGARIEIVDKDGSPMFPVGSPEITDSARNIFKVIAGSIKTGNAKVEIEGHTDALSYSTGQYGNWELSTARASAARVELERNGLQPSRLIRVSGYAANVPLVKNDPMDARNRRISLVLYNSGREPVHGAQAVAAKAIGVQEGDFRKGEQSGVGR